MASMDDRYFEDMYAGDPDPWGFESRFYERRKYALTVASLRRPTYRSAFEPGCSNGALTELLAPRCEQLTSCDIVQSTVDRARSRLVGFDHVDVVTGRMPHFWPDEPLDLVVWSEVAYYLDGPSLDAAVRELGERLTDDGELVVVNYTGDTNYPQTADEVDSRIVVAGFLERRASLRDERFRLDVWSRLD